MKAAFQAGERAPCSGIYRAAHGRRHTPPHYVMALPGDTFPECVECLGEVRFELALHVVYLKSDPQFGHVNDGRGTQYLDL